MGEILLWIVVGIVSSRILLALDRSAKAKAEKEHFAKQIIESIKIIDIRHDRFSLAKVVITRIEVNQRIYQVVFKIDCAEYESTAYNINIKRLLHKFLGVKFGDMMIELQGEIIGVHNKIV
jgi:hypothetical protein